MRRAIEGVLNRSGRAGYHRASLKSQTIVVLGCLLVMGCQTGPGDTFMDIVFDPCEPVRLEPSADATSAEVASVDSAVALWNQVGFVAATREDVAGAPELPIRFEKSFPALHGVYEDEIGEVIINRLITDPHTRSVTIAHELGHSFGLWHVDPDVRRSVMNPGNADVEPTAEDIAKLTDEWGGCVAGD
jgi:hypothetical protein